MKSFETLFEEAPTRSYTKGQILLYQAEQTESAFFIKEGYVKVSDVTSEGNEKLLVILGPGDIYPLVWTFGVSDKLLYFYEAQTDVTIQVIPRTKLLKAVESDHALTQDLLRYFVNRSRQLMLRIECLEASNALYKVAQVLEYLATSHGSEETKATRKIAVHITHQNIAAMAGVSRETASIQMKQLEEKKIVNQDANHLVVHVAKLHKLLDKE